MRLLALLLLAVGPARGLVGPAGTECRRAVGRVRRDRCREAYDGGGPAFPSSSYADAAVRPRLEVWYMR